MNYLGLDTEQLQELLAENLKALGFEGIDYSTDISLFEYGLLVREIHEYQCSIKPNIYYQCIYVTRWAEYEVPAYYDISTITEGEIKELFNEDLFESESFLSTCGMNKKEWFELPIQHKISDMLLYYGYENIFGSSYSPMDNVELIEWAESELNREGLIK